MIVLAGVSYGTTTKSHPRFDSSRTIPNFAPKSINTTFLPRFGIGNTLFVETRAT